MKQDELPGLIKVLDEKVNQLIHTSDIFARNNLTCQRVFEDCIDFIKIRGDIEDNDKKIGQQYLFEFKPGLLHRAKEMNRRKEAARMSSDLRYSPHTALLPQFNHIDNSNGSKSQAKLVIQGKSDNIPSSSNFSNLRPGTVSKMS